MSATDTTMSLQTGGLHVHVDPDRRVVNIHHAADYTISTTEIPDPLADIAPGAFATTTYTEVPEVVDSDASSDDDDDAADEGKQGTALCVGVDRRGNNVFWWCDDFDGKPALTDQQAGPDHEWAPADCPADVHTKVRTSGSGAVVRALSMGDAAAIAVTVHHMKGRGGGESVFVSDAPAGHARRFAGKYRRANPAAKKMIAAKAKALYSPGWWKLGAKAIGERAKAVQELFNIIS